MKIGIKGDTHCSISDMEATFDYAREHGIEFILHVGDFGYYPRKELGAKFLTRVEDLIDLYHIPLWFIDGNHEDHHTLLQKVADWGTDTAVPCYERGLLKYIPRGMRFTIDGFNFLGYGGTYSINRYDHPGYNMIKGEDWFDEEIIDWDHIMSVPLEPHVDVMLTHDVPEGVNLNLYNGTDIKECAAERAKLFWLVSSLEPVMLFAGHHHVRQSHVLNLMNGHQVQVEILDKNNTPTHPVPIENTLYTLDTEDLKLP